MIKNFYSILNDLNMGETNYNFKFLFNFLLWNELPLFYVLYQIKIDNFFTKINESHERDAYITLKKWYINKNINYCNNYFTIICVNGDKWINRAAVGNI